MTMDDYNKYLQEKGVTEKQFQIIVNIDNVKETTSSVYYKSDSKIHGIGVFASKDIKKGEIIGDVSEDGKYRTTLGRWINHSKNNNVSFYNKKDGINMFAVADKNIVSNEEILVNYRHHTNNVNFKKAIQVIKQFVD